MNVLNDMGRGVPWAIDATTMDRLLSWLVGPEVPWTSVGDRPLEAPASWLLSRVEDVGTAGVVLVAARPADIMRVATDAAETSARAGADHGATIVTIDWPLPGLPTTSGESAGHQLYTYDHLASTLSFDDTRRLVVVHPNYSGMLTASVHALDDVGELVVEADPSLAKAVRPVTAPGPLGAGQIRAIDLVLDPGAIPARGLVGMLLAHDALRADRIPARLEFHLYRSGTIECTVAGEHDGPLDAEAFASTLERAHLPLVGPRRAARAIERAWHGDAGSDSTAPWWAVAQEVDRDS